MATQAHKFDAVSDYILSNIDIHVSGACGPGRSQPIECFYPVHQAYSADSSKKHAPIDNCMENVIPGGVSRPVESLAARDEYGLVYDRDIVTTWRLPDTLSAYQIFFWEKEFERALGRNTMFVVLEAFCDTYPEFSDDGDCDAFELMETFRRFVEGLGTRMVSITTSSIVLDMMDSFRRMKEGLKTDSFAWEKPDLVTALHEFVLTRECWQYAKNHEPALEVNFGVTGGRRSRDRRHVSEEIVLQFHYSWNPPTIGFENLQNVVFESASFILKPSDGAKGYFHGSIPYSVAPAIGAQRLDSYTLALDLTTKITKHFSGGIKYETIIRCALPLTVKRQPDACKTRYRATTQLPSPLRSMLPMIPRPDTCDVEVRMVRNITLHSDVEEVPSYCGWETSTHTFQSPTPHFSTPYRNMGATKVNRRGDLSSDSDAGSPDPTPRAVSILLSPEKRPLQQSPTRHRRRPATRSVGSSPDLTVSDSARRLPRSFQKNSNKSPVRATPRPHLWGILGELPSWNKIIARSTVHGPGRSSKSLRETHMGDINKRLFKGGDGSFPGNASSSHDEQGSDIALVDKPLATPPPSAKLADLPEHDVEKWQKEIQRNYQDSLENKENDILMQAEAWSDEE